MCSFCISICSIFCYQQFVRLVSGGCLVHVSSVGCWLGWVTVGFMANEFLSNPQLLPRPLAIAREESCKGGDPSSKVPASVTDGTRRQFTDTIDATWRANHTILCWKSLFSGSLGDEVLWGHRRFGDARMWQQASQPHRKLADHALRLHQDSPPPKNRPIGEDAFRRLLGAKASSPYNAAQVSFDVRPGEFK